MEDEIPSPPDVDSRTKGAMSYFPFIGWIISTFLILTERDDHYARFNAIQSILLHIYFLSLYVLLVILQGLLERLSFIEVILGSAIILLGPIYLAVSILMVYKGSLGERTMLPKLGLTAEKHM